MANVENLKKRAKTLVKQHHAGQLTVATRLRRGLPRFADLSDKAIVAAPFALADALDVVAHEQGFASWETLSRAAKGSPAPPSRPGTDARTELLAAYPQALVADVSRAADFYREKLGFAVLYLYGEPPFYGLVERDGARINLRHVRDPASHRAASEPDVLTANIPVRGVKALFLELRGRGVDFVQRLKEQPWGASDFLVRDLDGNLLCFASDVEVTPPVAADTTTPRSTPRRR